MLMNAFPRVDVWDGPGGGGMAGRCDTRDCRELVRDSFNHNCVIG